MAQIQYFIQHRLWCEQTSSRSVPAALAPENLTFGFNPLNGKQGNDGKCTHAGLSGFFILSSLLEKY